MHPFSLSYRSALMMGALLAGSTLVMAAQTTTPTNPKPAPAPAKAVYKPQQPSKAVLRPAPAAAKPVTTPPVAKPVAAPAAAAVSNASPAASSTPVGASYTANNAVTPATNTSLTAYNGPTSNFAAGLGRFTYGDTSAVAFGCMRSNTRVFCDFDELKQNIAQMPAGWAYSGVALVLDGGHIVNTKSAFYLDNYGNMFQTAELSPNAPVRMMLEYDDVPPQYTTVSLTFGQNRIQNIAVSDMGAQQPNGAMPARSTQQPVAATTQAAAAAGAPAAAAPAAGTAAAAATNGNAADTVNNTVNKANATKSKWMSVWKNVQAAGTNATKTQ